MLPYKIELFNPNLHDQLYKQLSKLLLAHHILILYLTVILITSLVRDDRDLEQTIMVSSKQVDERFAQALYTYIYIKISRLIGNNGITRGMKNCYWLRWEVDLDQLVVEIYRPKVTSSMILGAS